jgi:hypothetical protein
MTVSRDLAWFLLMTEALPTPKSCYVMESSSGILAMFKFEAEVGAATRPVINCQSAWSVGGGRRLAEGWQNHTYFPGGWVYTTHCQAFHTRYLKGVTDHYFLPRAKR